MPPERQTFRSSTGQSTTGQTTTMNTSIDIGIKTNYLEEQSQPEADQFVFTYTITIQNNGLQAAQLISRYWHIVDSNNEVQEVQGIGVVGEQPRLKAGESYTYTSGAVLETASGTMSGKYIMRYDNGEKFEAPIPTFALVQPLALH